MLLKDDSGSYAVFTEQGSFASQLTAAKVMDVVDKQQTHPDIWIRLQKPKWPKLMVQHGRPSRSS